MSDTIRYVLVIAAILGYIFFIMNIRKSKFVIADSIYWFVFAAIVLILGLFPQIAFAVSRVLGVATAALLVDLVIIALLLLRIFIMDMKISQLNTKLQSLIQDTAIFIADHEIEKEKEKEKAAALLTEMPQKKEPVLALPAELQKDQETALALPAETLKEKEEDSMTVQQ